MQNIFSIDGHYFNVIIPQGGIKRSFAVLDGEKTGRVKSGRMDRDIIGTFYNYTVDLDTNGLSHTEYDNLYELISAPVEYHVLRLPYGQHFLTFNAYITGGDDILDLVGAQGNLWSGLSLKFIAMNPQRT